MSDLNFKLIGKHPPRASAPHSGRKPVEELQMDTTKTFVPRQDVKDMSALAESVVVEAMAEKIRRLKHELASVNERMLRAERNSVEHVLRPLRRRETVLLYFGDEPADVYEETLRQNYPEETVKHVMQEVFFLNGSQLNSTQKNALRLSLRERWFPTLRQDA